MNSTEKNLSEKESLAIIQEMILEARSNIKDNGFFYLLWGWLVFAAAIIHYTLMEFTSFQYPFISWPVLMTLGGIISGIYGYKNKRKEQVTSYLEKFMYYLWGGFTISLFIVLGFMIKIGPDIAYPIVIILYGLGTFVSGGVLKFKPLIIGGILCWMISIGTFFLPFNMQLIGIAMAILVSYIIPGHLLKANYEQV